jgi:chromosome partitioning protein
VIVWGISVSEILGRLTKELGQSSPLDLAIKLAAAVILAAGIYLLQKLARWLWGWGRSSLGPWWGCCRKLARARDAVEERGPGLWLSITRTPPTVVEKLKDLGKLFLTIANLKGGVGKTTVAANLAAFFANPFNEPNRPSRRVLVIDLDFQGSCSSMVLAGTDWQPGENQLSRASELINGSINADSRGQLGQPVTNVSGARGISAFYDLARVENSEMVRWLIGDEDEDIRYRLSQLLLSNAVLDHFDVILIDAPPRLTTASIQALCSSTHVLIPTILDALSAEAVGFFGRQLQAHEELWPNLKVLGVVGTMTDRRREDAERKELITAGDRLRVALEATRRNLRYLQTRGIALEFPYECSAFERASLSRAAGQGIAYVASTARDRGEAHEVFDPLGMEIQRRWLL